MHSIEKQFYSLFYISLNLYLRVNCIINLLDKLVWIIIFFIIIINNDFVSKERNKYFVSIVSI